MILRRLTKIQKVEILEAYRAGENTIVLAEKYSCTTNTINRTVKNLISDSEYKLLKEKRSKKGKLSSNTIVKEIKDGFENPNSITTTREIANEEDQSIKSNEKVYVPEIEKVDSSLDEVDDFKEDSTSEYHKRKDPDCDENNQNFDTKFEEIAPLISNFDFDIDKKIKDFKILNYESLPDIVYMIVDKKVELELQPISDLPEWSFLPENELQRNAILLFSNQRNAKRICSRNQRVIKVPNTSIFKLSKPYLISNGITRLIFEDSIIGLDN